jgi:hypothetical protein
MMNWDWPLESPVRHLRISCMNWTISPLICRIVYFIALSVQIDVLKRKDRMITASWIASQLLKLVFPSEFLKYLWLQLYIGDRTDMADNEIVVPWNQLRWLKGYLVGKQLCECLKCPATESFRQLRSVIICQRMDFLTHVTSPLLSKKAFCQLNGRHSQRDQTFTTTMKIKWIKPVHMLSAPPRPQFQRLFNLLPWTAIARLALHSEGCRAGKVSCDSGTSSSFWSGMFGGEANCSLYPLIMESVPENAPMIASVWRVQNNRNQHKSVWADSVLFLFSWDRYVVYESRHRYVQDWELRTIRLSDLADRCRM